VPSATKRAAAYRGEPHRPLAIREAFRD
jgi:hypothetical protein